MGHIILYRKATTHREKVASEIIRWATHGTGSSGLSVQHVQHSALSIYLAVQVFKVGPPEMFSSPNNRKQSRMNENACLVHSESLPSIPCSPP